MAPRYGYSRSGELYVPSHGEILSEFFHKLNLFRSRKNWLAVFGWVATLGMAVPLWLFLRYHFSWTLVVIGFFYSMVGLGTHGTIWLHRYATHRAYRFRNPVFRTICRNLVIKIIPEEIYVISHHVHHWISEQPGDPYNAHAGFLYCFLADVNHQTINPDLSEKDYAQLCKLMAHTGVKLNSYAQYQRWGSLCHPLYSIGHYALNWLFWYGTFYWMGGHALALALFGSAGVWAVGVRTFNYEGHGRGKDRRRKGIDFNTRDLSVNQVWPGYVASEWHNNHHLYPNSARCGFLPYQLDLAWLFIRFYSLIGGIVSYKDNRADFMRDYYLPYLAGKTVEPPGEAAGLPEPNLLPAENGV